MPYKNHEDRKAFDRRRKAEAREANPARVRLLESQQKQLARLDRAAEAKARLRPPGKSRWSAAEPDPDRLEYTVGSGVAKTIRDNPEALAELRRRSKALPLEEKLREWRGAADFDQPGDIVHHSEYKARRGQRWSHLIPMEVTGAHTRAVALAIIKLAGSLFGRAEGTSVRQLEELAGPGLARSLKRLARSGRLYVDERAQLFILPTGELPGPEPETVHTQRAVERLDAALRGGRNPITESFELKDAFEGEAENDLSRSDLLGA